MQLFELLVIVVCYEIYSFCVMVFTYGDIFAYLLLIIEANS